MFLDVQASFQTNQTLRFLAKSKYGSKSKEINKIAKKEEEDGKLKGDSNVSTN